MISFSSRNHITIIKNIQQKQKQKRIRTWSSDSGCDVECNNTDMAACIMDESIQSWTNMLEEVVGQEVAKAKKITIWAKEDIGNSLKDANEERGHEVLATYTRQIEGIMNCTSALMESVNDDIKTGICEKFGRLAVGENIHQIDKICEEQEPCKAFYEYSFEGEENVMQRKTEVEISLFDKNDVTGESGDGNVLHDSDIFDDWDWSSVEFDDQLEEVYTKNILHMQFYDDPEIEPIWNSLNFWKMKDNGNSTEIIDDELAARDYEKLCVNISKEDLIAWVDPAGDDLLIQYEEAANIFYQIHGFEENIEHSPIISGDENIEKSSSPAENYLHFWLNEVCWAETGAGRKNLDEEWTSWRFWDDFGDVEYILDAYEDIIKFGDISLTENKGN